MSEVERQRLAVLHEYHLLDAPAGDELEAVVRVAAMVAGVPTATLNLIDENRQCQLTTTGFQGADSPRADSMCAVHFENGKLTYLPDASQDPQFAANPWVTGQLADVRFYASAPLVTPQGHALGTLCVFDSVPRELSTEQLARLEDLAEVILALFERRRQARINAELLAEAEARQQFTDAVLETIDVAVAAADPDGHLTLFNRASREWHGLDADPSVDPGDFAERYRLFHTDGRTPLTEAEIPLLRALRGGAVRNAEMIIAPEGRRPVHVVADGRALTAADGRPLGAVVVMADVTADRQRREALEQALVELRRSNAELEQFAGVVSHDLAAPLAVISGYLELLADNYREELDDQAQKWISSATRSVGRVQGLIDALLTYARAGSAPCRRAKADLGEVADQALMDLRDTVRAAGAKVTVAADLPTLAVDPTLIRQLLQNLIGNAIKYAHPERPVRVAVAAEPHGTSWMVTVTDNGIGIPAAQRRRVFEMFTQIDDGRPGYGVGLSTCQRIVERHGGRIWAEQAPGGGTVIAFTVPEA
ncbi:ATP-binding protein [Actinoplanes sp. N902-109]|uniref:sensor histidine kinase n=1 Tax=Actinoplanes sp. (strain N902-109) TaxID=649831 RepID=UPI0003295526|nr:ATP-binding protein [Actinoplanes sp. N902-109]AGL18191.1 multi-sensor signal transduction histidine kinase [Actinoplanes sp. N902-109]